jgi:urease accessory protein
MQRATRVKPAGGWSGPAVDKVVLDYESRHRRRLRLSGIAGFEFLLDLPEAVALRDGDGLLLDDGRLVAVQAVPEPVMEVRGRDARHLLRLAWHLGNRHLPTELGDDCLRIRADRVVAEMLKGLGATVVELEAPFQPEGGAYAVAGGHGHRHGHDHGHDHDAESGRARRPGDLRPLR